MEPLTFFEELSKSGPSDIYELVALVESPDKAVEFLVRECQEKDRRIGVLSRILQAELGNGVWTRYGQAVQDAKLPYEPPDNVVPLSPVPLKEPDINF